MVQLKTEMRSRHHTMILWDVNSSHSLSCSKKPDGVKTDVMLQFKQKQQRDWDTYEQWPEASTYVTHLWDAEQKHYRFVDKFPKNIFRFPCHWADSDKSVFTYTVNKYYKTHGLFPHENNVLPLKNPWMPTQKKKTPPPTSSSSPHKGMLVHLFNIKNIPCTHTVKKVKHLQQI